MRSVVAMTGASGSIYGIRLLQELPGEKILVMSKVAKAILPVETDYTLKQVEALADTVYRDDDMFAPISSGSYQYDVLFVAPCTESSVAKFACGIGDTLISRAVMCALKEHRKTFLLTRETPKDAIMLENELKLARNGAIIMDANPGFYPHPKTVEEVVDFVVGRCLQMAGVPQALFKPWNGRQDE
ncbi:MAG: UbiX family flavin prenyltransferase [Candidatus Methanomethylophilus sp.]|nr:UbiX family flavin prenyltransferase [Methanomethylophilus sp.]MDD3232846.1 UbiX family flavin prenyltransferase [Methanomethylophilus sp.]MDD4222045.1 UbiX family flavin prenyltransferase [Methanomethylophilus sp.]